MFFSSNLKICTFGLDWEEFSVPQHSQIWEAANVQGIQIPYLCHKPEPVYRSDANCRACMVEIEGERVLAASCVRNVSEGMIVNSDSARAKTASATILELLVPDQPQVPHDISSHFSDMAKVNDV